MSVPNKYLRLLMTNARVELPGSSDAGIRLALYTVLDEFFKFTAAWQETVTLAIVADQQDYPLTLTGVPPGQVFKLAGVIDKNKAPQPAAMATLGTVSLRDTPNTAQTFYALVLKTVRLGDCEEDGLPSIPDEIAQLWMPNFLHGLLGNMMAQPSKSYTNTPMAKYHRAMFDQTMADVRGSVLRQNTYGTNSWMYPQSFRTRGQRGGVSVGNPSRF